MTAMCFCKQVVGWYCTGKKILVIFWFLSQYLKVLKSTGLKKVNQRRIAVLTYCQYLAGCFSQTDVVGNLGLYLCWISTNTHYWLLSGYPVFCLSLVARCLLLSLPGPDGRQPAGDHLHHQPPEQLWWILPRTALDPGACPAVPRLSRLHAFKEETNRGLGYGFYFTFTLSTSEVFCGLTDWLDAVHLYQPDMNLSAVSELELAGKKPAMEELQPEADSQAVEVLRSLGRDLLAIRLKVEQQLSASQSSEEWMQVGFIIDRLLFALYIFFIIVSFVTIIIVWLNSYHQ